MHPAKSVIFFTTASGAGYGVLAWLGLLAAFGLIAPDRGLGLVAFGLALSLVVGGLLSSTFHLGHPERAWRALSQWRSSWLSREGVAAIATFAPVGLFVLAWIFLGTNTGWAGAVGVIAAIASLATVYCTSMIYASLKTIPAWSNVWTPIAYIVLALSTGGILLSFLFSIWGLALTTGWMLLAAGLSALALVVKLVYWRSIASAAAVSTAETATGLGAFGGVRLIDAPHTQSNYLLEEMGFQIARDHAQKLRMIAILSGFLAPVIFLLLGAAAPQAALLFSTLAVLGGGVGIVVERWLFFAEAKHAVTLYYGQSRV